MEGGIGILLLLVIFVVVAGFGIAMYFTGGALLFSKDKRSDPGKRPEHKRVTSETIENTEVVGTGRDDKSTR